MAPRKSREPDALDVMLGLGAGRKVRPLNRPLPPDWLWFGDPKRSPTPNQRRFIDSRATPLLFGGGRGSGKSMGFVMKFTDYAIRYPGIQMSLGRRFFTEMAQNMWPDFEQYWLRMNDQYKLGIEFQTATTLRVWQVMFPTGSVIHLQGFEDPRSFQGMNRNVIGIDEATQLDEESLKEADGRVGRSGFAVDVNTSFPSQVIYGANKAEGPIKDEIVTPAKQGTLHLKYPKGEFIQASTYDLQDHYDRMHQNADGGEHYIERQLRRFTEADLRGEWDADEGGVWRPLRETGEDRDVITIEEMHEKFGGPVRQDEMVYFGLDHGVGHPTAILFGVIRPSPDGNGSVLIIFSEFYEPLDTRPHVFLVSVIRESIYPSTRHQGWWDTRMKHALRQAGNKDIDPREQLRRAGVVGYNAATNKAAGVHAVTEAMHARRVLMVKSGTPNLRREWASYRRAGKAAKPGTDPCLPAGNAKNDHACDAVRYLIAGLISQKLLEVNVDLRLLLAESPEDVSNENRGLKPVWTIDDDDEFGPSNRRPHVRHGLLPILR